MEDFKWFREPFQDPLQIICAFLSGYQSVDSPQKFARKIYVYAHVRNWSHASIKRRCRIDTTLIFQLVPIPDAVIGRVKNRIKNCRICYGVTGPLCRNIVKKIRDASCVSLSPSGCCALPIPSSHLTGEAVSEAIKVCDDLQLVKSIGQNKRHCWRCDGHSGVDITAPPTFLLKMIGYKSEEIPFLVLTCPPVVIPHLGWFRSVDSGGTFRVPSPPRLLSCRDGPSGRTSWTIWRASKEATKTVPTTAGLLGSDTSFLSQFARESHSSVPSRERTAAPRSILVLNKN